MDPSHQQVVDALRERARQAQRLPRHVIDEARLLVCDEAVTQLVPFAWSLPFSLVAPLVAYAERRRNPNTNGAGGRRPARDRAIALLETLAPLEPLARGRHAWPLALYVGPQACAECPTFAADDKSTHATHVVSWTKRRGRERCYGLRCAAHAAAFAKPARKARKRRKAKAKR